MGVAQVVDAWFGVDVGGFCGGVPYVVGEPFGA
ncbi:Uncharacterised protein [Chlamydia trachomatis]|nr:Uncharacterised protein [Chlamydia trachomatis]